MDALWNIEDRLKLSTPGSIAFLACTAVLVIGIICIATALIRKSWANKNKIRSSSVHQEPPPSTCMEELKEVKWCSGAAEQQPSCGGVKKVLMSSVRWSGVVNKWPEEEIRQRERPTPLLVSARFEANVGWQSHNSTSPVWQRPILMGEKCELPRFSGLILYDERGRPLHDHCDQGSIDYQVNQ